MRESKSTLLQGFGGEINYIAKKNHKTINKKEILIKLLHTMSSYNNIAKIINARDESRTREIRVLTPSNPN